MKLLVLVLVLMVFTQTMVEPTAWPRTTGSSALDLRGKMFTLSRYYGGITFYPPNYHSSSTSPTPYPTRRNTHHSRATTNTYPTSTPSYIASYPWTTESPTTGVSVCVRYMADEESGFPLFTLSPNRSPLKVDVSFNSYGLSFSGSYNYAYLRPLIMFWPNIRRDFWTSMCLTVDTRKGVVQLFSGRNMTVRKVLPSQYVWSGEPVIDFSGFDGQLTDVQVWDYPLRYKEIYYYMNRDYYGSYSGSVLSWSHISYSPRGTAVMEDSYSLQAREPIGKVAQKRGLKRERLKFLSLDQRSEDPKKQLF